MILIIDNYDSFTYNLYQLVAAAKQAVQVVRNNKININYIKKLAPSGIILSPGPGLPEHAGACIEIIQAFSGQIPILGVCLGHQAIAVAFGGMVVQSSQIIHGKTAPVFHNHGALYQEILSPFPAGRYHSLMVDKKTLPSQLKIEAQTAHQIIMGLRHITHPTFGVQFHPESILSDFGMQLIENFLMHCSMEAEIC